ncbi:nuclear transport factor 2 family protein [uncultured Chryseobacterium sp.]|uniref:nuclear transport factor 2 family protein n=1 Tax=uncultured Chryseobacterium sp. TaxID=259322 RepID=UPI00258CC484|nr:nuclear transport factor 2 family protein [uncultured Chryseobacterium sp.]
MKKKLSQIAEEFIKTLQSRNSAEELIPFYHQDIEQIEFPNTFTKNMTISNLDDLKLASERGKKVLLKEEFEIIKLYSFDNTVIIEALWTGTLAVPIGNIPAGGQMKAYFAQFYEFKDDKIIKQRNYDCFEPFN